MRGLGERVQHVADPHRVRIGEVEGAAVEAVEMGEMVHRGDDEVDRHDIDPAALDADHRDPRGHGVAQLLDQLEEVVGAVDLVDLASPGIADHNARPVDPPRNLRLRPHQALALVLGRVIRMVEAAGLLEHVLAEHAVVEAGRGDRAHMVKAARLDALGEGERVGDASDIGGDDHGRVGFEIVDGGEVEEVVDLALELRGVLGCDSEIGPRDVALDEFDPFRPLAPERSQPVDEIGRRLVHEQVDGLVVPFQQAPNQTPADESGPAGDERAHELSSPLKPLSSG